MSHGLGEAPMRTASDAEWGEGGLAALCDAKVPRMRFGQRAPNQCKGPFRFVALCYFSEVSGHTMVNTRECLSLSDYRCGGVYVYVYVLCDGAKLQNIGGKRLIIGRC